MKRICYGLAMPGLLITAILFTHVRLHLLQARLDFRLEWGPR
jgi:hypothetical protein